MMTAKRQLMTFIFYESIRTIRAESVDSYTSRFKDAFNDYNNYLSDARKRTQREINRHYMKNLSPEFDSEKIQLKN